MSPASTNRSRYGVLFLNFLIISADSSRFFSPEMFALVVVIGKSIFFINVEINLLSEILIAIVSSPPVKA